MSEERKTLISLIEQAQANIYKGKEDATCEAHASLIEAVNVLLTCKKSDYEEDETRFLLIQKKAVDVAAMMAVKIITVIFSILGGLWFFISRIASE